MSFHSQSIFLVPARRLIGKKVFALGLLFFSSQSNALAELKQGAEFMYKGATCSIFSHDGGTVFALVRKPSSDLKTNQVIQLPTELVLDLPDAGQCTSRKTEPTDLVRQAYAAVILGTLNTRATQKK